MWLRRTFHECAEELEMVSKSFRTSFTKSSEVDQQRRGEILRDSSQKGVEILRVLALSIRPEQDYDEVFNRATRDIPVGALKCSASTTDIFDAINNYRPPYSQKADFKQLGLRDALNKIAHADPSQSGFFANDVFHDLILSGKDQKGRIWIAIISIIDLCRAVKSLPDQVIQH